MVILSDLYARFHQAGPVLSAFNGLQVIVVAIVANAAWDFGRSTIRDVADSLIAVAAALFLVAGGSPIAAIVACAAAGALVYRGRSGGEVDRSATLEEETPCAASLAVLAGFVPITITALWLLDRQLFSLALTMIKVDMFAFGGGYASLPIMLHEVVQVHQWMDNKAFMDGIALGQVTPGPIVITAAFVGYLLAGLKGAVVAGVAIFTPSFLVLLGSVSYLDRIREKPAFARVIRGVLVSFVGLLMAVTVKFGLDVPWEVVRFLLAAGALAALRMKVDLLWVVAVGAVLSVLLL